MQIYLLRHGVAEVGKAGSPDSDRALTPDGKRKLREVLQMARLAGVKPGLILTSPYRRAVETAEIAARVLGVRQSILHTKALVPSASVMDVWDEIRAHRSEEQILLAGHEPLFGQLFAYLLAAPALQVDFKKGAIARIDMEQFNAQPRGVLRWFLPPKLAALTD
jgi:phosphohistidine phosphatase